MLRHAYLPVYFPVDSLVQTLIGNHEKACRDVEQAIGLMNDSADPMLRHELNVRQATCRQRRSINGKD